MVQKLETHPVETGILFAQARKTIDTERRKTEWAPREFIDVLGEVYEVFDQYPPYFGFARIGREPFYNPSQYDVKLGSKTPVEQMHPLNGLHIVVLHSLEHSTSRLAFLYNQKAEEWRKRRVHEGDGLHYTVHTSYVHEEHAVRKAESMTLDGMAQIFPLPGLTRETLQDVLARIGKN